ncbi:hypothetical protein R80B4_02020 [Fibrobacteres bacterium R8-0-B4]
MSKHNPNPAPHPRLRVRSSLSAAAVVVWSVLWVVGGCGKKSGQEVVPGTIDTLSVISDTLHEALDTLSEIPDTVLVGMARAQNIDVDKATNLLRTLYGSTILSGNYLDHGNKDVTSKYFSSNMVDLLYLNHKCEIDSGGICRLDADFLCACQDMTDKFSVMFETKSVKPIQVLAKITDFGDTIEIQFNFIIENGTIKIDDVITKGKYSLKKLLQSPLP